MNFRGKLQFCSNPGGSPTSSAEWKFAIVSCNVMQWSGFDHKHIVVFEKLKLNWGDVILKINCFPGRKMYAKNFGSTKVYGRLISSESLSLFEIVLLLWECIFSVRIIECTDCIHSNSNLTNLSIVQNVFFNELVLSGRNDKNLYQSLRTINFHNSIWRHVHFVIVRMIFESNTTSVRRKINISKTNAGLSLILFMCVSLWLVVA